MLAVCLDSLLTLPFSHLPVPRGHLQPLRHWRALQDMSLTGSLPCSDSPVAPLGPPIPPHAAANPSLAPASGASFQSPSNQAPPCLRDSAPAVPEGLPSPQSTLSLSHSGLLLNRSILRGAFQSSPSHIPFPISFLSAFHSFILAIPYPVAASCSGSSREAHRSCCNLSPPSPGPNTVPGADHPTQYWFHCQRTHHLSQEVSSAHSWVMLLTTQRGCGEGRMTASRSP